MSRAGVPGSVSVIPSPSLEYLAPAPFCAEPRAGVCRVSGLCLVSLCTQEERQVQRCSVAFPEHSAGAVALGTALEHSAEEEESVTDIPALYLHEKPVLPVPGTTRCSSGTGE